LKTTDPSRFTYWHLAVALCCTVVLAACAHGRATPSGLSSDIEVDSIRMDEHGDVIQALSFSRDGERLASVSLDGSVGVWRASDGSLRHSFEHGCTNERGEPWVYDVAFGRADGLIAIACQDAIRLWSLASRSFVGRLSTGRGGDALARRYAIAFDSSGRYLAQAGWATRAGTIRIWDATKRVLLHEFPGYGPVAFGPDARVIAHAVPRKDDENNDGKAINLGANLADTDQHRVRLTDMKTGAPIRTLEGEQAADDMLAFSLDGELIAGTNGRDISVWRRDSGTRVVSKRISLEGSRAWTSADAVCALAFTRSGDHLLVGTQSGSLGRLSLDSKAWQPLVQRPTVWASEADVRQPVDYPELFYFRQKMTVFSPEARWMAATSGDTAIRLYHVRPEAR
jgi:WD40 repeat protein